MLQCCVCRLWRYVLWLNGASYRTKVNIDSLEEVVYEKSIGTKIYDLDYCLEVVQGHVNHCDVNISITTWARDFKFGTRLCMGNAERAHR